jgi:hypothetical protein
MGSSEPSRLKVERAKKHVSDIDHEIRAFGDTRPYVIGAKPHRILALRHTTLFVESVDPVPLQISLIVGDAIHNLRSALDHLVWQLVLANRKHPTTKNSFIIEDPAKESDSRTFDRKVEGIDTRAKELIRAMQPRNSGDHTLWHINELDNADKHRVILTAQLASKSWNVKALGLQVIEFDHPAFPLVLNQEITNLPTATYERQQNNDFKLSIDVTFGDSEIFCGKPIVETLNHLAEFVDGVIACFERFFE